MSRDETPPSAGPPAHSVPQAPVRPADVARWLFWVQGRRLLPVESPRAVRAALPLWRAQYLAARGHHALLADEYRRCFGEVGADAVRGAYRVAFRAHYEELLLGKLTESNWPHYMRMEGLEHIDAARAGGKGAIVMFPHAGNFMLMHAAIALAGYPYTQYAARGLAPPEVAAEHPELFGHNWFRAETRRTREEAEDRLPTKFITMETPLRTLFRRLEENELVGIAFDGRIGTKFMAVPYLGRTALLNPGGFRMAILTGAPIVPCTVECPPSGPDICRFYPAVSPAGHSAGSLCAAFLPTIESWLRTHPEQYGTWLLHCRERNAVDDHPLFTDYAPDDRYKRHPRG